MSRIAHEPVIFQFGCHGQGRPGATVFFGRPFASWGHTIWPCERLWNDEVLQGVRPKGNGAEMRLGITVAAAIYLVIGASLAFGQAGGGAGGGAGGSAGGGAASGRGGTSAPSAGAPPTSTAPNVPGSPAPGVAAPIDPGRNNVDVNPPTRQLHGQNPATTGTPMSGPASGAAAPGGATSQQQGKAAGRPGAAKSANSDGYSECMSMWNPSDTRESRDEWSKTCERTRLPPK
jgi:hypothetical protein